MNSSMDTAPDGPPAKHAVSFLHLGTIPRVLYYLAIAGLVAYAGLYIAHAIAAVLYPYQIDYEEGFLLLFAEKLAQGQSIYHGLTSYPYVPVTYTPFYLWLCAAFLKLTGITFAVGRALSIASAVLVGGLVYLILRRETGRNVALLAVLVIFASPFMYWTTLFRVDALGLFFSLAGIFLIWKYENSNKVYFSIIFFFLAIMTKQSFVAAPAAAFLYLLLKDRKRAFMMLAGLLLSTVSAFAVLNVLTSGAFIYNIVTLQAWPISINRLTNLGEYFLQVHSILVASALGMAIFSFARRRATVFTFYVLTSAIVAVTVGKVGSSVNYFLELIVASAILVGMLVKETDFENALRKADLIGCLTVVALLAQLALFLHGAQLPSLQDMRADKTISQLVGQVKGDVLAEDVGALVLNHKEVFMDFFEMTQLQEQGLWNQSEFISDLQNRKFSLIILDVNSSNDVDTTRFTPQMFDSISSNYKVADKIGRYLIYVRAAPQS